MLTIARKGNVITEGDEQRIKVMNQAVWEMDALVRSLPDLVPMAEDQVHFVVRGLCGRMVQLTGILMCALDESETDMSKLMSKLTLQGAGQD